jgi:hypothetical protein
MGIVLDLSSLALGPLVEGACQVVGAKASEQLVSGVVTLLAKRFTDQSARLTRAVEKANERAWKALEIALAGDSFWERCKVQLAGGEERAFRAQVRDFLDGIPASELPANKDEFRRQCWQELRKARKAGVLTGGVPSAEQLARRAGAFARFREPQLLLRAQHETLAHMARALGDLGYNRLAQLLAPHEGTSLLVVAARYFLRRAIEEDTQLFQGLAFAQLEQVQAGQEQGFASLAQLLNEHGDQLETLLNDVAATVEETHSAVLDVRQELQRQGEQNRELYQAVLDLQARFDLMRADLRPRDTLSIRDEAERKLVRKVIERYRSLPEDQRRQQPALLNAIGKLEVAAGSFEAAERDFAAVADLVPDPRARAEAHANAYRAALEQRNWSVAQQELLKAIELDSGRFAPFPIDAYRLVRILGAGGCGVAFLCEDVERKDKVVVKTLLHDGLECDIEQLFAEAEVLGKLDHPGVVRLRAHGFTDPAKQSRPYLVMEHFDGVTLEEYIREQGPLSFGEWLTLARQMADALVLAHRKGILHRDVKPANVLVRAGQEGLRAQLIDFGLALRQQTLRDSQRGNSLVGVSIAGTLDYAAPEQLGRLPGVKPGRYSDVYGFGRTGCYALFQTAHPAFKHWQSVPTALANLLNRCIGETPDERLADFAVVLRGLDRVQWDLRAQNVLTRVQAMPVAEVAARADRPRSAVRAATARPDRPVRPVRVTDTEPAPEEEEEERPLGPQTVVAGLPLWIWGGLAVGLLFLFVGGILLIASLAQKRAPAAGPNTPAGSPAAQRGQPAPSGPRVVAPAEKDPEDRKVYLSDLPEFDTGGFPAFWGFGKNGDLGDTWHNRLKADAHSYSKGLGMHPAEHTYSRVKYRIEPAEVFQALAGMDDSASATLQGDFFFEVVGDGQTLWKSKPVRDRGQFQNCRVSVKGVQVLELRVYAPSSGGNHGGHAVWLDPYITRPADYRAPEPAKPSTLENGKAGEKVYLSDFPEKDAGPFPQGWHFGKNGEAGDGNKIKVDGKESPKGLGMHPPGGEKPCSVKYQLGRRDATFEATVAISESNWPTFSDVIFEVVGDGKVLWTSKPVNCGRPDKCKVDLKGVRVLELRTKCGAATGCHAVWLDPVITLAAPPEGKP